MNKMVRPGVLALALMFGGNALAFMDTGTIITHSAMATFMAGGQASQATYSSTSRILIANPSLFIWKQSTPTNIGTAGGWATYVICFSNGGFNTAYNLLLTDRVPYGSSGVAIGTNGSWVAGGTVTGTYSTIGANGPFVTPLIPAGGITSTVGGLWLHWVVTQVGIGASGCINFAANILP